MKRRIAVAAAAAAGIAACLFVLAGLHWRTRPTAAAAAPPPTATKPAATQPPLPAGAVAFATTHYTILSSATPAQTSRVADAVEALHAAYAGVFREVSEAGEAKLQLVLYHDRREFKAHNRSSPWAEAYYLRPRCHAYYADGTANPYHWMLHEATHQLNAQVAHFPRRKWIDEGLASYFGASRLEGGRLLPGSIDADAYPIWWLPDLALGGDAQADIRAGRFIALRDLVGGTGSDIARHVNLYYVEYWSLAHFLFHYRDGRYAEAYRRLILAGGSLQDFERLIGPVDRVQDEWHDYLRARSDEARRTRRRVEWIAAPSGQSR
ncbi:MAG TPA: DUF1570 domain-containing protein [Luteimonas sp.]|nr:DUF1570 domain-containing protein [Luteimonas sp.]